MLSLFYTVSGLYTPHMASSEILIVTYLFIQYFAQICLLYSFLHVGSQSVPCNPLSKQCMDKQWFLLHCAPDFEFVCELDCDYFWQINFVIIKSHTDFFSIYF